VKQRFRLKIGSRLQTKVIRPAELSPMDEAAVNLWTKSMMPAIADAMAIVRFV
jgi:hypothetical protein